MVVKGCSVMKGRFLEGENLTGADTSALKPTSQQNCGASAICSVLGGKTEIDTFDAVCDSMWGQSNTYK